MQCRRFGPSRQFIQRVHLIHQVIMKQIVGTCLVAGFVLASVVNGQAGTCPDGSPWNEKLGVDEFGCNVDYCSKVCPTGAFTNDGRQVTFRGNVGAPGTGSNGNAGPLAYTAAGAVPVDPAAESLKRQQERYVKWAEQQIENGKRLQEKLAQNPNNGR